MDVIGILISLAVLVALAYRGITVLVLAPLVALIAVVLQLDAPLLASYTQVFMPAAAGFISGVTRRSLPPTLESPQARELATLL